ncbi:hypothetical protein [Limnoglobus roseus]|uniref:Uncharacterized protein n=1 Tax=Limnoglobus roseus TaxID=2598579 RepID=A0A5C1ABD1_9BACT|nr:hypothetical protein [Limnoglobus roseus]QEL16551.1 hypothetical protein PX52LOC_03511 [Limnoglobus roseus]
MIYDKSEPDDIGNVSLCYRADAWLWCNLQETQGQITDVNGSPQTGARAIITVTGYPALTALDMLKDTSDQIWRIETLYYANNNTICDCFRFDSGFEDFVICD